ncbi:MAG: hypothetical protein JST76_11545, partial [Bacteroidetes bacterium]|nr:hypothetical protein [Bacteroidota bacterium]
MRKLLIIILSLCTAIGASAQTRDFQYFKSLGTVQFYEKNYLEAVFNLQQASSLKPNDKEVTDFLRMSY